MILDRDGVLIGGEVVSARMRARMSPDLVGLWHRPGPATFASSLVERRKPAPDLVLLVARQMAVLPEACPVVEDSLPGLQPDPPAARSPVSPIPCQTLCGRVKGAPPSNRLGAE